MTESFNRKKEIAKLLNRLYVMHDWYMKDDDNDFRSKVFEMSEVTLAELEKLGVHRPFSETFLAFGDEFVTTEFGVTWPEIKKDLNA